MANATRVKLIKNMPNERLRANRGQALWQMMVEYAWPGRQ